jgi:TPR repeat protein
MMVNGRGGRPFPGGARALFEKAAAKGHAGAMFALGALHAGGHGLAADRAAAQKWFRAAAELGHGHAQLMLGRYLATGVAGEPDCLQARIWLERAAAQGISEAETELAGTTLERAPGRSLPASKEGSGMPEPP